MRIAPEAKAAVIAGMRLNGATDQSEIRLTLFADESVLRGNRITNRHSAASCIHVNRYHSRPAPRGVRIVGNKIHDCGALPATNHHHGIYVAEARRTVIRGNWIYDNANRGIQLYPAAQRTRARGNILESNGQALTISGDESGRCSNRNLIMRNVLSRSRLGWNASSGGQGPACRGNVVRRNCVYARRSLGHYAENGGIKKPSRSFRAKRNRIARPRYRNRKSGDLRLRPGTRCDRIVSGGRSGSR